MKTRNFQKYVGRAAVIALLGFASVAASAVGAHAQAALTFGSVNVDQVVEQSKARQADVKELNGLLETLRGVTTRLQQGPALFLTSAELHELSGLYEKAAPTEAERKRIAAIESLGEKRRGDMTQLENTGAPTDAQKKQIRDLTDMRQQGEQNLNGLREEFQSRMQTRGAELESKTLAMIKDVITSVAKSKNLSVVFDARVAIYTANDITADVVKQVNK